MKLDRRRLFAALAGAASASAATPTLAREMRTPPGAMRSSAAGNEGARAILDAATLGVRPNAEADQSAALQRAIDRAAAARSVLQLAPGIYRAGALQLPAFAAITGVPGATRIVMSGGPSLLAATGSDRITLSGLILDGAGIPLPERRGLVQIAHGRAIRIADCDIVAAGQSGISLQAIEGEITGTTIEAADYAINSVDGAGLRIAANTIRSAGNGGIFVWRSTAGDDGTLIVDNRIDNIANKAGGLGQWGNGIAMFRADNVIVRGNRIRNTAYSSIRGNTCSNLQIVGNTCSNAAEVGLFVEFGFLGAVVANNIVDGAATGAALANFDVGGRLGVVQGNLFRNLHKARPEGGDTLAFGIDVAADTVVTGNIVENVEGIGIRAGYGPYLRDVTITANVLRSTDIGIGISVVPGAGTALITDNLISGARQTAIAGMEWEKMVADDLNSEGARRYAQLSIAGNKVR